MRADSIHSMVTSKCLTIKNKASRVYVATMGANGDCRVYYDNELLGYLVARGKKSNSFFIQFYQNGFLFKSVVKYNDVILFRKGEKLPQEKVSHLQAERIMDKDFHYHLGIPLDEVKNN